MGNQRNAQPVGVARAMRDAVASRSSARKLPPGADPATYQADKMTALLKSAAYFSIFNAPNPANPNIPVLLIPGISFLMTAVEIGQAS